MSLSKEELERIELIYRGQYLSLLNYAVCVLRNVSLAEEAVQDTFRIACSKPQKLFASPNPPGWITNVLKNVIKKILSQQKSYNKLLLKIMAAPKDEIISSDNPLSFETICSYLLDKDDFELFKKIDIEGYSIADAAKACGIGVEACKKRIQRIRKKLKDLYKE